MQVIRVKLLASSVHIHEMLAGLAIPTLCDSALLNVYGAGSLPKCITVHLCDFKSVPGASDVQFLKVHFELLTHPSPCENCKPKVKITELYVLRGSTCFKLFNHQASLQMS